MPKSLVLRFEIKTCDKFAYYNFKILKVKIILEKIHWKVIGIIQKV